MHNHIKAWAFRLLFTAAFILGMLVTFMLNPVLLYAHKTVLGNYTVYHNGALDKNFTQQLGRAGAIIKTSELYNPALKMDVCLKDGSPYPALVEKVMGKDVITQFYNKQVFTGDAINYRDNYIEIYGHRCNLAQMLAHAGVHCLEFNHYGLFKANPLGKHPAWKWEGYPEYIARQNTGAANLRAGISTLLQTEHANNNGWLPLPDHTEVPVIYLEYRLLVQYCIEVKRMPFVQLLADTTQQTAVRRQMLGWYNAQH
jgi:hypothetical protein